MAFAHWSKGLFRDGGGNSFFFFGTDYLNKPIHVHATIITSMAINIS
ncbi:hypothetical protein ACSS6N_23005 [Peribacillus frigoritolerans]